MNKAALVIGGLGIVGVGVLIWRDAKAQEKPQCGSDAEYQQLIADVASSTDPAVIRGIAALLRSRQWCNSSTASAAMVSAQGLDAYASALGG